MSSTFFHFFFCHRVKKNMLESLEFMKNQFLWAPSIHKFSYMMNYEKKNNLSIGKFTKYVLMNVRKVYDLQ